MPLKNIIILAAAVVGFGLFLIALSRVMMQADSGQNTPAIINPK
ncbi:MAG TPA: hypothetical protein VK859_13295 [bacterium]|nr:hypothetical protein [bacterium]